MFAAIYPVRSKSPKATADIPLASRTSNGASRALSADEVKLLYNMGR